MKPAAPRVRARGQRCQAADELGTWAAPHTTHRSRRESGGGSGAAASELPYEARAADQPGYSMDSRLARAARSAASPACRRDGRLVRLPNARSEVGRIAEHLSDLRSHPDRIDEQASRSEADLGLPRVADDPDLSSGHGARGTRMSSGRSGRGVPISGTRGIRIPGTTSSRGSRPERNASVTSSAVTSCLRTANVSLGSHTSTSPARPMRDMELKPSSSRRPPAWPPGAATSGGLNRSAQPATR